MSKKKKSNKSKIHKTTTTKTKSKAGIIAIVTVAIVAVVAIIAVIVNSGSPDYSELTSYTWVPTLAKNASGDEADMSEVYDTKYSSYKGSLTFKEDGTFSIWLAPGSADDGTHTGKFSIKDTDIIDVTFDDSTEAEFKISRRNSDISYIAVNYNGYEVQFTKQ